jgi:hypothetical protein
VIDVVFDCIDAAGNQVWACEATSTDQSLSIVAPNQQVRHTFPNYNYMTVWETNPDGTPNYNAPHVRYQLGTDLSSLGGPINNAYAPFPRSALTDAELALGTGAVSRPDTVTFSLNNMKELSGTAAYQVWAIDAAGAATALDFLYTPPGGTQTTASSFVGGEGTHEVIVEYPDDATTLVISLESSAGAASPGAAQILWAPGLQEAGPSKVTNLPISFGTFSEMRTWGISGLGEGGLLGDELRYLYQALPRPPVGYKYVGWLSSGDTLFARLDDATFTTPPGDGYQELANADTDTDISDLVVETQILEAMTKICVESGETGCFNIGSYDTFFIGLEPKSGIMTDPGPTRVLQGVLPAQ